MVLGQLSYQFMNLFCPVKSGKISELIAQQIRTIILNGTMEPGDKLPPERELVEQFQASRISVREALKSLEASALLTIKPGSGVFVAEVNSKPMSKSLASILQIQKATINDLTETRIILEPSIARLASIRIKPEDFLKLEQNIQKGSALVKSGFSGRANNIEFHSIIAESTHNPVIALLMKILLEVLKETAFEIDDTSSEYIKIASHTVSYHKKILKALREKNSKKVYELMFRHILQIQGGLEKVQSKTN